MAKKDEISKEQLKAAELVNKSYTDNNITLSQMERILDSILDKQLKSTKAVEDAVAGAEAEKDAIAGTNALLDRKIQKEKSAIQQNSDLSSILTTNKQTTEEMVGSLNNMADLSEKSAKAKKAEIATQRAQLKDQFTFNKLTMEQKASYSDIVKSLNEREAVINNLQKLQNNKQAKAIAGAYDAANDNIEKMDENLKGVFADMPGGSMLSKMMGVDSFAASMKGEVTKAFAAMNTQIATGGGLAGALKAAMKGFNAIVMMNPLLLVVAAGAALFAILKKNEETIKGFADASGMDYVNSKRIVEQTRMRKTLNNETLATMEDVLAVQQSSMNSMGIFGELSNEVASSIAETGVAFGYGAKKAGEVNTAFMEMGATQTEAAELQKSLAADSFKAGVNLSAVMEDVAQNSLDASRYMGGAGLKGITAAAVQAAKMGLSLKDLTGMADGLLDIESSLTAQFEFQALTGKQMNVDKARQLALEGDLEGMAKEIASEAKKAGGFEKMKRYEKEKMAKMYGMEVGALTKMLSMEKAREKHGVKLTEQAEALGVSADEMNKMSADEIRAAMTKKQNAASLSKSMSDLGDTLTGLILPVAEAFGAVLGTIAYVVNGILAPFRYIGSLLESSGAAGQVLLGVIKGIGIGYLAWLTYQKLSSMWSDKKAKKDRQSLIDMNDAAKAEEEIAARKTESNDIAKKSVDLADKQLQKEKKTTKEMKEQNKTATKGNDLAAVQNKQASGGGGGGGLMGKAKGLLGKGKKLLTGKNMMAAGGAAMGAYSMFGGGGGDDAAAAGPDNSMEGMASRGNSYATGGTVGNTGLAKVHAGETITPANKVPGSEPAGGGGGGSSIDYDKMTQAFMAAMNQMPAPQVNLDGKAVSDSISARQSYNRGIS